MRQALLLVIDLILISLATIFALVLRDNLEITADQLVRLGPYLFFTAAAGMIILPLSGASRAVWRFMALVDCLRIFAATVAMVSAAVAFGFGFNRMDGIARAVPVLQALLILFTLVGVRILVRLWHAARDLTFQVESHMAPVQCETALVVGFGRLADLYLGYVAQFARDRVRIAGLVTLDDRYPGSTVRGHPILGPAERIADVLRDRESHGVFVDRIVVTTAFEKLPWQVQDALVEIEKASNIRLELLAEQMGLVPYPPYRVEEGFEPDIEACNPAVLSFGKTELVALMRRPYWRVKRTFDVVGALLLLVLLVPFMLAITILVMIDLGLPVTFWQQRPGFGRQPFKLRKFRTMTTAHDSCGRRVCDEARTSCIGHFLRRTRLDELPQLLNVIIGEMSFVGPRPLLPADQPAAYAARLLVRPGLTGWAQVKGGRQLSAADKAALDIWYVWNASLSLDLQILACTVLMVLFGDRVDDAAIGKAWHELELAGMYTSADFADKQPDWVAVTRGTEKAVLG
jgi:lipopolysaccharide/colanic/teichoic acid biosynthesis glycosyltransferase